MDSVKYRILADTPLGHYQSEATVLTDEEKDSLERMLGSADLKTFRFYTSSGSAVFLREGILSESVLILERVL